MKRLILFPVVFALLLISLNGQAYTNVCGDDGNPYLR